MKCFRIVVTICAVFSLFGAEIRQTIEPSDDLWGDPKNIQFDKKHVVYINHNIFIDNWMVASRFMNSVSEKQWHDITHQPNVPARRRFQVTITLKKVLKRELPLQAVLLAQMPFKRRLVLINVEQAGSNYDKQYRVYPHLGMLYVATVASEAGWEVVIHDELIQGHADLGSLVETGDVVGLSLVITGMERGIYLSHWAKALGANAVIAGNDSAIFRANQILPQPGKPIDAVFASNSTNALRDFFLQYNGRNLHEIFIPQMKKNPDNYQSSNSTDTLLLQLEARKHMRANGTFDNQDGFVIPDFKLYTSEYWEQVWTNYRASYGHKHIDPATVRNAIGLLAQGCTRTQGKEACSYCSIYGVADIRVPSEQYMEATLDAYNRFGITGFFNVTDSAYEMTHLLRSLENIQAKFEALTIYGRAQGLSLHPQYLDDWQKLVRSRLLINVGMDSGDEQILSGGVIKSSLIKGSRLEENRTAVRRIRDSGAHLHYSLIFGSPGETIESCDRTLEFLQWSADTLGPKLDLVETDLYWLNFGAPASQVFTDYNYALHLAGNTSKYLSREQWAQDFASHANDLIVSWETERAWYRHFTNIDLETAQEYNQRATTMMAKHSGAIIGRAFNPLQEG